MTFADIILFDARAVIAERLADPTMVRWTSAELTRLIQDGLRTWNAYTAFYRQPVVFATVANQVFYDLPTVASSVRGYTLTVQDLLTRLQDALLEPATPTVWTGTQQFVLEDLRGALERRRDQFLLETGAVVTASTLLVASAPQQGRIALPIQIATVRRVAWEDSAGIVTPLYRDDEWGAQAYEPAWPQTPRRPPRSYSVTTVPPLEIQLFPPPLDSGRVHLVTVDVGPALSIPLNTLLTIPDDWAWVVEYGALADLLSQDGTAHDPLRAAYCEARWAQGIEAAMTAATVLTGRVTDVPIQLSSVADADRYRPGWQTTPGAPTALLTTGQNLLATAPRADTPPAGSYSLTLDVVANMDVPVADGDYLQILPEQLDTLFDYVQHLALFKEGPGVLEASMALFTRFTRAVGIEGTLQQASQPARRPLLDQTTQDERVVPRMLPVA